MTDFRDLAQRSLDASFSRLGEDAAYRQLISGSLGAPFTVRVIPTTRERLQSGYNDERVMSERAFKVRASQVQQPVQGEEVTHLGKSYDVRSAYHDDDRGLVWIIATRLK